MRIEIGYAVPMRRWQARLVDELSARGHAVRLVARGGKTLGFGVAAALAIEQRLFGPRPSLFDVVTGFPSGGHAIDAGQTDLVIALDSVISKGARVLEPLFDEGQGDDALLAMLTSGQAPFVRMQLRRSQSIFDIVGACLAIEDRDILSRQLDQVLARVVTLLLQAVRRLEYDAPALPQQIAMPQAGGHAGGPLAHIANTCLRKIGARVSGARRGPHHWRVGYRRLASDGPRGDGWGCQSFSILPDDGTSFYADPVPFEHEGRNFVFVEDYPYATGKAVIAVIEIDAAGAASAPRTVLEQPCHLSYPVIVPHRGEIYMMPEMSGARRVQLFRADPFPDRWVPDIVLLDNVVAADATPIEHEGRWWMFATLSDDGGSSWDQLCLYHAPDLFGPWMPHADNPVLVDAGAARPAGAMWFDEAGALMRVAQDCREGYGVGLTICRVDRLDPQRYAQTVLASLEPAAGFGADGVHTLNRAGDLEVIDLRFSGPCSAGPFPYPEARPATARG